MYIRDISPYMNRPKNHSTKLSLKRPNNSRFVNRRTQVTDLNSDVRLNGVMGKQYHVDLSDSITKKEESF